MEYNMSNLPTTTSDLINSLMAVETQIAAPQAGDGMDSNPSLKDLSNAANYQCLTITQQHGPNSVAFS